MTASAPTRTGRIDLAPDFPVLDSLRAVGALAVLTTHTSFQAGAYTGHGVWGTLLSRLDVGVAIFFVLSGFLLSRPHFARAAAEAPAPRVGRYYWKRLVRIYPVYVVTVVIALAAIPENEGVGSRDWWRSLLMIDVYLEDRLPHGLTQMWSLAAEVAFYAVLPLLMWVVLGRRRAPSARRVGAVLVGLVVLSVAWHLALAESAGEVLRGVPPNWLPAYLSWFAVGIGLAHAHVEAQANPRPTRAVQLLQRLGAMPGTSWTLAAGVMLVAATPLAGPTLLVLPTSAESLTKNLLYAVVGGLVVVTGVFTADGRYSRTMSLPLLRHLGHISYSLFCIHLAVLSLTMAVTGYGLFEGHGVQIWAITLVLSLVASELLYRLVEMPGMRLKNLGRSSRPRPARSTSASEATQPSNAAEATTTR